jgi:hypothetical protein
VTLASTLCLSGIDGCILATSCDANPSARQVRRNSAWHPPQIKSKHFCPHQRIALGARTNPREATPSEAQEDEDFSSGGGAPFPSSIPSASAASTRTLGSLSPASCRRGRRACSIPGKAGPRRPRCQAAKLRTKASLVAQLRDEDGDRLSTRRRHPSEGRRRPDAHEPNRVLEGRGEVGHSLGCRGANLT